MSYGSLWVVLWLFFVFLLKGVILVVLMKCGVFMRMGNWEIFCKIFLLCIFGSFVMVVVVCVLCCVLIVVVVVRLLWMWMKLCSVWIVMKMDWLDVWFVFKKWDLCVCLCGIGGEFGDVMSVGVVVDDWYGRWFIIWFIDLWVGVRVYIYIYGISFVNF